MNKVRGAALVVALAGAAALGGCQSKVQQCNRLIEVANAQQEQIAQTMNRLGGGPPDPAQLDAIAVAFDQAVLRVAAVQLKDPRLVALSGEFQGDIRQFGTIVRAMAVAARADNQDAYNALVPQIQQTSTRFSATIDRINAYCQQ